MAISRTGRGAVEAVKPFGDAVRMNVSAAIRTRRRGYDGWTGAVNTDYDPQNPATAAQPFDAYRPLPGGGCITPRDEPLGSSVDSKTFEPRCAIPTRSPVPRESPGSECRHRLRCSPTAKNTPGCASRSNPDSAREP